MPTYLYDKNYNGNVYNQYDGGYDQSYYGNLNGSAMQRAAGSKSYRDYNPVQFVNYSTRQSNDTKQGLFTDNPLDVLIKKIDDYIEMTKRSAVMSELSLWIILGMTLVIVLVIIVTCSSVSRRR